MAQKQKRGSVDRRGVYAIRNVATGEAYIGYSADVDARFDEHRKCLRAGRHSSTRLLEAWKRYGASSFKLEMIEAIDDFVDISDEPLRVDTLRCFAKEREQFHVTRLGARCYNANQPVGEDYKRGVDHGKFEHGTWRGYQVHRCRCQACRTAWATYIREYRHSKFNQRSLNDSLVEREIARAEAALPDVAESEKDVQVSLALSPLDYQILLAIQRASRKRRGEIFGELLREHGRALTVSVAA